MPALRSAALGLCLLPLVACGSEQSPPADDQCVVAERVTDEEQVECEDEVG